MHYKAIKMFGLDFFAGTLSEFVDHIISNLPDPRGAVNCRVVVTPNVDHLVRLEGSVILQKEYVNVDYFLADGQPLVLLSRLLSRPLPERVSGADLMPAVLAKLNDLVSSSPRYIGVVGGFPGDEELIRGRLQARFPNLRFVVHCPIAGFDALGESGAQAAACFSDQVFDLLFVCLGVPKQELWVLHHKQVLNARFAFCVGAALDFMIGRQRRSPIVMQKVGMEWFWRLLQNPRRLWRRYLLDDPKFVVMAYRELTGGAPLKSGE